jgi:hypothetical protein
MACHEAAHAVIAAFLRILRNDSTISIIPDGRGEFGSVTFSKQALVHDSGKRWSTRYTRKIVLAQFAGPAATLKLEPGTDLLEEGGLYESDMLFSEYLMRFCGPRSSKERTWKESVALVERSWPAITSVADELLKRQSMRGQEVKAMLK